MRLRQLSIAATVASLAATLFGMGGCKEGASAPAVATRDASIGGILSILGMGTTEQRKAAAENLAKVPPEQLTPDVALELMNMARREGDPAVKAAIEDAIKKGPKVSRPRQPAGQMSVDRNLK